MHSAPFLLPYRANIAPDQDHIMSDEEDESSADEYVNDTHKKLNKEETRRIVEIQKVCNSLPNAKARMTTMLEKLDKEMKERRDALDARMQAAEKAKKSKKRRMALERRKAAGNTQLDDGEATVVAAGQEKARAKPWHERCAAEPAYTFDSWEDGYKTLREARAYGFKLLPGIPKAGAGSTSKELATCAAAACHNLPV